MYVKHGMTKSPEYQAWRNMLSRCLNPKAQMFHAYGGRGIRVCQEWQNSFSEFFAEIGPRPSKLHSLDRINNDGHYEPGNVRWSTRKQQQQNLRKSWRLTFNGKTQGLREWSRELGIPKTTIERRIKAGWTVNDALTGRETTCQNS